jgi:hypothetical protein
MQKKLTLSILLAFTTLLLVQAQEHLPLSELTSEWKLDMEKEGVQVFLKKVDCNDEANGIFQEVMLLQFVNTTSTDLRLSWDMELWYNGECYTCDPSQDKENHRTLMLDAGSVREGICDNTSPIELRQFVRFLNYDHIPVLTRYALDNFTVSPR